MSDALFLDRAIALARRAVNPAPNPRVGAVIVRDDVIVGEGWHEATGGPHAEIVALRRARTKARGATLFVTLEPCAHHGRTPPCVDAILKSGIARVVIGMPDPHEIATGGAAILRKNGIHVRIGVREDACRAINRIWLKSLAHTLPYVTLKLAFDEHGSTIPPTGRKWITNAAARKEVHRMRATHDAILVGVGTIIADDPHLTVRGVRVKKQPTRIILDPSGRMPHDAKIFAEDGETIIVTRAPHRFTRATNLVVPSFRLRTILTELRQRGLTSIFVEGGMTTATHFLHNDLIDAAAFFYAGHVPQDVTIGGKKLGYETYMRRSFGENTLVEMTPRFF